MCPVPLAERGWTSGVKAAYSEQAKNSGLGALLSYGHRRRKPEAVIRSAEPTSAPSSSRIEMKYYRMMIVNLTRADEKRLKEIAKFMKDYPMKTPLPSDVHFLLALLESDPEYLALWRKLERDGKIPEAG
jgi:hypothetical protein